MVCRWVIPVSTSATNLQNHQWRCQDLGRLLFVAILSGVYNKPNMKISVFLVLVIAGSAFAYDMQKELIRELLERLQSRQTLVSGIEDEMLEAYETVRDDNSNIRWAVFKYDGEILASPVTGTAYEEFLNLLGEGDRAYAYVRFSFGDDSRRKFVFITWIGPQVSPLKKAKVSIDKAFVKKIMNQFAQEILADERSELSESSIVAMLEQYSSVHA